MKIFIKVLAMLSALLVVLSCCGVGVAAYSGVPEVIRIGLFYGSTAKDSCEVTSTGGMDLGIANETDGWQLTKDESVNSVTVKKDSFYHVELKEGYDNYEAAWEKKTSLQSEGYPAFTAYRDGAFYVWVGVYQSESEAKQTASTLDASVLAPHSKRVLVYIGEDVWIGAQDETYYLTIAPIDGNLSIEGTAYRGNAQFMRRDTGDMTVVNVVEFDDYLCGVVPREVSASWNYEAVKAQAVVSRTFAIMNINKYQKYGFNLDNTTNSQAYAGIKIEHPASNKAVEETHGEVVLYEGKPADVYFFASSGGKTGTANDAWGGENKPYLMSVDDPYENPDEASYSNWKMTFTAAELKEKLAAKDVNIGDITDVTVEHSETGRVINTVFHGTSGTKEYSRENIRWVLGVYSTAFTVSRDGQQAMGTLCALDKYNSFTQIEINSDTQLLSADGISSAGSEVAVLSADESYTLESSGGGTGDFVFTGRGWGHGVGMSQWGAKGMADSGFSYKEIIEHYFTGTQVG